MRLFPKSAITQSVRCIRKRLDVPPPSGDFFSDDKLRYDESEVDAAFGPKVTQRHMRYGEMENQQLRAQKEHLDVVRKTAQQREFHEEKESSNKYHYPALESNATLQTAEDVRSWYTFFATYCRR